jgi:hypothetical protein
MSPHPRRRSAARTAPFLVGSLIVLALLLAGCAAPFDPTGPCTADGNAPGAYPELEAVVPTAFRDAAPAEVDSGRTCTSAGLGPLAAHGVKELRFAGATWTTGSESGLTLATFVDASGTPVDAAWLVEFYEVGARAGKNVTSVDVNDYPIGGNVLGRRIDVLNGESYQTLVIWKRGDAIAVAVIASAIREIQTKEAHEAVVRAAVDAYRR